MFMLGLAVLIVHGSFLDAAELFSGEGNVLSAIGLFMFPCAVLAALAWFWFIGYAVRKLAVS